MPVEQATYIAELDPSRPQGSESISEADDHARLQKSCISNTFLGSDSDKWDTALRVGPRALNALSDTLGLNSFVTLTGDQEISGAKSFTKVIKAIAGIVGDTALNLISRSGGYTTVGNQTEETALVSPSKDGFKASYGQSVANLIHTGNIADHVVNAVYPVGSVLYRSEPTNPGTQFPNTTWEQIPGGMYLISAGTNTDASGETRTYSVGYVDGTYRHSLTEAELPAHDHPLFFDDATPSGTIEGGFPASSNKVGFAAGGAGFTGRTNSTGSNAKIEKQLPAFVIYAFHRTA